MLALGYREYRSFYKKLWKDLEGQGFKINQYDPCITNKVVKGKQLTVTWHVDDLKVLHEDKTMVDEFIKWIKGKYKNLQNEAVKRQGA